MVRKATRRIFELYCFSVCLYCKSFCFVGENWIIRWAVKQAEEVCLAEEMSFLPLCWLFQASEHPPIELSNFRPRSKMIYTMGRWVACQNV